MINLNKFYLDLTPVIELIDFNPSIRVWMKRDELIHPILSGNKWRKLKYNLIEAKKNNIKTLITQGGYYSNHLAAVSEAGKLFGFKTIGIIRGEEPKDPGYTLNLLVQNGMQLVYTARNIYKQIDSSNYQNYSGQIEEALFIPEGGSNELALKGCRELIPEILGQIDFIPDTWCVSVGTGGTIAGILQSLSEQTSLIGFSALKGNFHSEALERLTGKNNSPNIEITDKFAGQGYARINDKLVNFINLFYDKYQIKLDPVYTGKMMYGVSQLTEEGCFSPGTKLVCIHTGGLQGLNGYKSSGFSFLA